MPQQLTEQQKQRYARHLLMPQFGEEAQTKLLNSSVLVVGAGGLGSAILQYVVGAGVGTVGIVEFDKLDISNLHRQVLYREEDLGRPKPQCALARLKSLNSDVTLRIYDEPLNPDNALDVIGQYDLVVDATDNFPARYLINDACVLAGKRFVHASIFQFEGQVTVLADPEGPCYRCQYPTPPPEGLVKAGGDAGVFGPAPGVIGCIQASEAIKLLAGVGKPLIGRILHMDLWTAKFSEYRIAKDPNCPACSANRTIHDLSAAETLYQASR